MRGYDRICLYGFGEMEKNLCILLGEQVLEMGSGQLVE